MPGIFRHPPLPQQPRPSAATIFVAPITGTAALATAPATMSADNVGLACAWYDAADTSTITIATGVSQWNDKSGYGNNVTQATGGSQPTETTLNGLNALAFSGSQSIQSNSTTAIPQGSSAWTICILASISNPTTTTYPGLLNWGNSASEETYLTVNPSGGSDYLSLEGYPTSFYVNSTTAIDASPHLYRVTYSGGDVGTNVAIQEDGTTVGLSYYGTPHTLGTSGQVVVVGGNWPGVIAEVIFYDVALSTTQGQVIEGYYAWKWGLEANLPPTHPYYSAAPVNVDVVTATAGAGGSSSLATDAVTMSASGTVTAPQTSPYQPNYQRQPLSVIFRRPAPMQPQPRHLMPPVGAVTGTAGLATDAVTMAASGAVTPHTRAPVSLAPTVFFRHPAPAQQQRPSAATLAVTPPPITGTAALATAPVTMTASGGVATVFGTAGAPGIISLLIYNAPGLATKPVTMNATGSAGIHGIAALATDVMTMSAAGLETIPGTAALTTAPVTMAASGIVQVTGVGAVATDTATMAASGALGNEGTAALATDAVTMSAVGQQVTVGSAAMATDTVTMAASGTVLNPVTGTAALATDPATMNAAGDVGAAGSSALATAPATMAASGAVANITGTASLATASVTTAGSGIAQVIGVATLVTAPTAMSASGVETIPGSATMATDSLTMSAAGAQLAPITGTAALATALATMAATGTETIPGTAAMATPSVVMAAVGAYAGQGISRAATAPLTMEAVGLNIPPPSSITLRLPIATSCVLTLPLETSVELDLPITTRVELVLEMV